MEKNKEELQKKEIPLMGEEEFKEYIKVDYMGDLYKGILHLRNYKGVSKFRSVRRAIRRGHISLLGDIYPKRPFNNAKHTKGSLNDEKRRLYTNLKGKL